MKDLAKALTLAVNSGNLPKSIEDKAISLLGDISKSIPLFVKDESKWDAMRIRALRIDMAYNFATGEWYSVRKSLNLPRLMFCLSEYTSKYTCAGCKYFHMELGKYGPYHWCSSHRKCPRRVGERDRIKSILIDWLIFHEPILINATKAYNKQLLYIAQNATQRYKGICGELYKTIQYELVNELRNYKSFKALCNQLTLNHC